MTTQAKIGHGCLFEIMDPSASPPGYVAVAEVKSITPAALSRDAVDVTHMESPEKWREYIPGLRDGGEVTLEMNFIPKGAGTLRVMATFNSDEKAQCRVTFNDDSPASVWTFEGFCTNFSPTVPIADAMTATATFKVAGKPTFLGS